MCSLCSMSGYSPAMSYYLCHITSFFALHSILFRSAFFFLGSALWTQLQLGGLFTFRGGELSDRCKHSPAQLSYVTWCYDDTIFIHGVCVCVCVCGLHFRLRFMWIYVCTTIYVMCLVALCVYTKRSNSLAFVYFSTWFSVSGFSFSFYLPFALV